jgi:hypothetical protein
MAHARIKEMPGLNPDREPTFLNSNSIIKPATKGKVFGYPCSQHTGDDESVDIQRKQLAVA